ncbi:hypothetical protein SM124_17665 [Bacillus sp. 31A1R]|uniref:Tetratricopeptide repeat-containing protein n=1 Tax=Robertmurraya mangrovi TaxID=3098077 RepID=A0ABU5J2F8_9BACI|nr:hypothetical protein [Bacillus sp. 31A1R]MDZ5473546.1 hypothetical protein [Bacillus sp. 31A1R]
MTDRNQLALVFIIALIVGLVGGFLNISTWIVLIVLLILLFIFVYWPFISNVYLSTDMNKVEQFLLKRQKQPLFHFYYAVANNLEDEAEIALDKLKQKYKSPQWTAAYTVSYAAYKGTLSQHENDIKQIKQENLRNYFTALMHIEQGELSKAQEMVPTIQKEWMKEEIQAAICVKQGNTEKAKLHHDRAIQLTKGMQRYLLVKKAEELAY